MSDAEVFSVASNGLPQVVELVRDGIVDGVAGVLHVVADGLRDVLDRKEIHDAFGTVRGPLDSAAASPPHGGARQLLRLPRERPGSALATSAKQHRYSGPGHDTEQRGRQQIVLISFTFGRAFVSV